MPGSASSDAIMIQDLRKRFGAFEALKGISMTVKQGEIFGLLGANGAGKSTLIKILVGSLPASGGSVAVLGANPAREAHALRRQLGYMPQAPALYEELSPRDNIRFFGKAHDLDNLERRIDEVLEFTSLRGREHDPVYGFSGGMKQRVSLSCALIHRPRVLLLDEPTAGVDPRLREAFWSHFRQLAAEGVTILVSTHQMDEVLHCDRAAVMRDGVVLACDTPRGLLRRGSSRVKIWRGAEAETLTVQNYSAELPRLLRDYGLNPDISRIELEEDTLETIVLAMINDQEQSLASSPRPVAVEVS